MMALIYWILGWMYTGLCWAYAIFAFSTHAILSFIFGRFFEDHEAFSIDLARCYAWFAMHFLGLNLTIEGKENLPEKKDNFILLSNHQSHMDIIVLIYALRYKISFIAKQELLKVPILGWTIKNQGHITIDRSDPRKSVSELKRVENLIENGRSVIMFPEGTRTENGQIGEFKKGAFMMAVHTGIPIIPCHIEGTYQYLNKHSLRMRPTKITLKIGKPILVQKITHPGEAKNAAMILLEKVREAILSLA